MISLRLLIMSGASLFSALIAWTAPVHAQAVTVETELSLSTPAQVGSNGFVRVGVKVYGTVSSGTHITIGAGYTISCGEAPVNAQRGGPLVATPGSPQLLTVPPTVPANQSFSEWSTWTAPTVKNCTFRYRGRAGAGQLNLTGSGADHVLSGPNATEEFTETFIMTKSAGECQVANPNVTTLGLDGEMRSLGANLGEPLTVRAASEDGGGSMVLDQFAVARVSRGTLKFDKVSDGFIPSRSLATRISLPSVEPATQATESSASTRPSSSHSPLLIVFHQGEHALNHNYAPSPEVSFSPQPVTIQKGSTTRGWAIVGFDRFGVPTDVRVLSADSTDHDPALLTAIRSGVHSNFQDDRTHPHTAYFSFNTSANEVVLKGKPIVTLPMCCNCSPQQCP